jgi:hypothetical protein
MNDSVGGNPGSTSLRSPEPVPVSAHAGNDPGRKWTPGPWKIFRASNGAMLGIGVDRPADEDHAAGVTDAYGGLWGSGGEKEANARLMATKLKTVEDEIEIHARDEEARASTSPSASPPSWARSITSRKSASRA